MLLRVFVILVVTLYGKPVFSSDYCVENNKRYCIEDEIRVGLLLSSGNKPSDNLIKYFINELSSVTDKKIKFNYFSSKTEALRALKAHKVHLVPTILPRGEIINNNDFIYTQPMYGEMVYAFSKNKIYSINDILTKNIISDNGHEIVKFINQYISSYKYNLDYKIVDDINHTLLNDSDIIVSTSINSNFHDGNFYVYKLGYLGEIVFAVNDEHFELLNLVDQFLEEDGVSKKISRFINSNREISDKKKMLSILSDQSKNFLMKKKINLLVDSDYAPYSYWSDFSKKHQGTVIELVSSINQRFNNLIKVIEKKGIDQNWEQIADRFSLSNNKNDYVSNLILISGIRLSQSNSDLHFTMPIDSIEIAIFKKPSKSYSDNLNIGVIESDLSEFAANDLLKINKDKNYNIIMYSTASKLKNAYFNGDVDAIIHNSKYIEIFFSYDYRILSQDYLYLASSDPNLIKALDEMLLLTSNNVSSSSDDMVQDKVLSSSRLDTLLVEENIRLKERSYLYFFLIFILIISVYLLFIFYSRSKKAAIYDQLTDLKNRRGLYDSTKEFNKTEGVSILIDIDNFKYFNDNYGHKFGDQILNNFALNLKLFFPKTSIFRLSGDEFFIYAPNLPIVDATKKLHLLLAKCENQTIYSYGFSAGLYYKEINDSQWLEKTDTAMYVRKSKGKRGLSYFDEEVAVNFRRLKYIETHLLSSIIKKEFTVFFQPQVNVSTGLIVGFESLARWNSPEIGNITPGEFIPAAEQQGVISQLDILIAEKTILAAKYLIQQDLIKPGFSISFNFSIDTLQNSTIIEQLKVLIKENGVNPAYFQVELTETQLILDRSSVLATLTNLKKFGVKIALDDFSTGNSSILHLASLPFDTVKLDRELLLMTCGKGCDRNLHFQSVIKMVKNFELEIIAEGVEGEREKQLVIENGIDIIQGYYYYKPMPYEELAFLLLKN